MECLAAVDGETEGVGGEGLAGEDEGGWGGGEYGVAGDEGEDCLGGGEAGVCCCCVLRGFAGAGVGASELEGGVIHGRSCGWIEGVGGAVECGCRGARKPLVAIEHGIAATLNPS